MRKLGTVLVLFMLMFLLTGCVKFNANMDVKKDKSMDFSVIYAINTSILGEDGLVEDDEKKNLEKQGFTVEDYSEDDMKGVKLERKIKNIDEVSSTEDVEYDISGLLDTDNKNENINIFKVKKGLLKNTYIANFKFDASESDLDDGEDYTEDSEEDYSLDLSDDSEIDWSMLDTDDSEDGSELDFGSDFSGLTDMASKMDLSFNVTLPYPAKSNNATSTNNDNKELKWDLSSENTEKIEFEFELYNMSTIYIIVGLAVLLVVVIIIVVSSKGKKNTTNNVETTEQTM